MTKHQNAFNDLVAEVGLSTADVASIAGVTSRAVYHWQSGKIAPPQSLLLLLQAMVQGKITREWVNDWVADQSSKQETQECLITKLASTN